MANHSELEMTIRKHEEIISQLMRIIAKTNNQLCELKSKFDELEEQVKVRN